MSGGGSEAAGLRAREYRVVEGVKELRAEVHRSELGDFCVLRDGQIPVLLEGAAEGVAPHVSEWGESRASRIRAGNRDVLIVHAEIGVRNGSIRKGAIPERGRIDESS